MISFLKIINEAILCKIPRSALKKKKTSPVFWNQNIYRMFLYTIYMDLSLAGRVLECCIAFMFPGWCPLYYRLLTHYNLLKVTQLSVHDMSSMFLKPVLYRPDQFQSQTGLFDWLKVFFCFHLTVWWFWLISVVKGNQRLIWGQCLHGLKIWSPYLTKEYRYSRP